MESRALPVVVIAAAGRAKRFSGEQKVLALVGGRPAICRVADTCQQAWGPHRQVVVIGHEGARVRAALGKAPHRQYVTQEQLLGTGHALQLALSRLEGVPQRRVFFLCGDKPLLSARSLRRIEHDLDTSGAAMAFLIGTIEGEVASNRQGRVLQARPRTPRAEALGIVERAMIDAMNGEALRFESQSGEWHTYTREQLLAVPDVNLSAYVWPEHVLRAHVGKLELHPEKGEYFVTDLVEVLRRQRLLVRAVSASVEGEGLGIDTPEQLRTAERAWRRLQPSGATANRPVWAGDDGVDERVSDALL